MADTLLHDRCHPTSGRLLRASPVMPKLVCVGRGEYSLHLDPAVGWCYVCKSFAAWKHTMWPDAMRHLDCAAWHPCGRVDGCVGVYDRHMLPPQYYSIARFRQDRFEANTLLGWCDRLMPDPNPRDPNPCTVEE